MTQIKLTRGEASRILDAMEDAKMELVVLEEQMEWYTTKVIDRLEQAIQELELSMAQAEINSV